MTKPTILPDGFKFLMADLRKYYIDIAKVTYYSIASCLNEDDKEVFWAEFYFSNSTPIDSINFDTEKEATNYAHQLMTPYSYFREV